METEKTLLKATLVFPVNKMGEVLLGIKGRKIGKGLWNGYGGGIDEDETIRAAAVRELFQESGLIAEEKDLHKCAIITFNNTKEDGTEFTCTMHVFFVYKWEGKENETEEMLTPTWFAKDKLPYKEMMLADRKWVPPVMEGKKIMGVAYYGPHQKTLLKETEIMKVPYFAE